MPTWHDVIMHVRAARQTELEAAGHEPESIQQRVRNTAAAITSYLKVMNIDVYETVDATTFHKGRYQESLSAYSAKARASANLAPATITKHRSELNYTRQVAQDLIKSRIQNHNPLTPFVYELNRLIKNKGISRAGFLKAIYLRPATQYYRLFSGEVVPTRESVSRMESYLGVPQEHLNKLLPLRRHRHLKKDTTFQLLSKSFQNTKIKKILAHVPDGYEFLDPSEQMRIAHEINQTILKRGDADHIAGLCKTEYRYRIFTQTGGTRPSMPTGLLNECKQLYEFNTAAISRDLQRTKRLKPASANTKQKEMAVIFGALRELGFPEDAMTLGILVTSPKAINRVVDFLKERRGIYTRNHTGIYMQTSSLLTEKVGFVRQNPDLFTPALTPVPGWISQADIDRVIADWDTGCEKARAYLRQQMGQLSNYLKEHKLVGRDPFYPILPILEADQPLVEYGKILTEARQRLTPVNIDEGEAATNARDLLMLHLIGLVGLRQKNWRDLYICLPGTKRRSEDDLYRAQAGEMFYEDGRWQIWMPINGFKNPDSSVFNHATHHHEILPNSKALHGDIDRYLSLRPRLLNLTPDSGRLFMPLSNKRGSAEFTLGNHFSAAFKNAIRRWGVFNPQTGQGALKGIRPFGPHAVRDIIATHILKVTGGDVRAAAQALLDTEQTIRNSYGRFLPKDAVKKPRQLQASALEAAET